MPKNKIALPDNAKVRQFYQDGKKILRALTKARQESHSIYATGVIDDQAKRLGMSTAAVYKAGQFASLYTEAEATRLFNAKSGIGIGHVYQLIRVPEAAERRRLLKQTIARQWSVSQLRAAREKGKGPPGKYWKVGRPPKLAADEQGLRNQLRDEARRWLRWISAVESRLGDPPPSRWGEISDDLRKVSVPIKKLLKTLKCPVEEPKPRGRAKRS